jgi:hypothetical protein
MTNQDPTPQYKKDSEVPHIEPCGCAREVSGDDAVLLLEHAAELADIARTAEIKAEIFDSDDPTGDPALDGNLYSTTLREKHKKASQRQRNRILDPGAERIKNLKRRRNPSNQDSEQQRYAQRVAERTGEDAEIVRAEQDAMRQEREVKRGLKKYLMQGLGYSDSGARKYIARLTNDEKDQICSEPECARYLDAARTAGDRPEHVSVGVREWVDPPLPQRDPTLSDGARLIRERDIDKEALREQLQRDTERFLATGGCINTVDDWYPADKHCPHIRGERHIKSTWGYVQNNARTGREYRED